MYGILGYIYILPVIVVVVAVVHQVYLKVLIIVLCLAAFQNWSDIESMWLYSDGRKSH